MRNRLVIIGASGHGKVIADIALKNGHEDILFVDDNTRGECLGFPIVGTSERLNALDDGKTDFLIAIGNNYTRKRIAETYKLPWATLVHPMATIGVETEIQPGTVVMAGAVINPGAKIGKHCIINTSAVIEHDNILGDYVYISLNAALAGTVSVGDCTHIGVGATVKNNLSIGKNIVVGAGAVVVKNIFDEGVYTGIPAKKRGGGVIQTCSYIAHISIRGYAA